MEIRLFQCKSFLFSGRSGNFSAGSRSLFQTFFSGRENLIWIFPSQTETFPPPAVGLLRRGVGEIEIQFTRPKSLCAYVQFSYECWTMAINSASISSERSFISILCKISKWTFGDINMINNGNVMQKRFCSFCAVASNWVAFSDVESHEEETAKITAMGRTELFPTSLGISRACMSRPLR